MNSDALILRIHALKRMSQRAIDESDIRAVLATGMTIEVYPKDTPLPSRLVSGTSGNRPIHVVVATEPDNGATIVITVYEPGDDRWDSGFTRRKKK